VSDGHGKEAVSIIIRSTKTENVREGNIFILPSEEEIRVRTNETGDETL
jgi:nitrogen regulatory protein PII